jgi:hypothetical protein
MAHLKMEFFSLLPFLIFACMAAYVVAQMIREDSATKNQPLDQEGHPPSSNLPSSSSISLFELGEAIAASIRYSHSIKDLSQSTQTILSQSKIGFTKFQEEKFILAGAVQSFTLYKVLNGHPKRNEILNGHTKAWENITTQPSSNLCSFETYTERCISYAHAAEKESSGTIRQVAMEFSKNVGAGNTPANQFALDTASGIHDGVAMATVHALRESGVI